MRPLKDDSFPQFPNFQDDNMSVVDDTISLATNASEDDQQWNSTSALDSPNDDDIFKSNGDDEVAVAEEAETLDVAQQLSSVHKRFLARQVNVLQAFLLNTNVYIAIADGQTRVCGYASRCTIAELLDVVCSNVYSSLSKSSPPRPNVADGSVDDAHVHFEVLSSSDKSAPVKIRVNLKDLRLSLTDEILSHLGPFVEFEDTGDKPPHLVINIRNTLITTKDPKKKQPLQIKLKDVEICQFADEAEET
uniref:Rad60-SLD domain-containing protein n=1 Tax=Steinernema glaseri TaxID=37863 RepID=A0A1I7YZB4_9BILA